MNREQASVFLDALGGPTFTFQTFDDNSERKDGRLAQILHGTLDELAATLDALNARGAGVFVTVNETDLRGRHSTNVKAIRAVFVDLDGSSLDPVLAWTLKPHIVVESSPGRWHAYWSVSDLPLEYFTSIQKYLAGLFAGDPKVHDLPRVMRVPGFIHRKGEPFESRVVSIDAFDPYPADTFEMVEKEKPRTRKAVGDAGRLNDIALDNLESWVPAVFGNDAVPKAGVYRISSKALGRDLQEDLSISPQGIKDFGVHDMGDKREGKRSPIDVVMQHLGKTFEEAVRWLRDRLGYQGVVIDDFWAYMPSHVYIYVPTGEMWPGASVNSRVPPIPLHNADGSPKTEEDKNGKVKQRYVSASAWLDRNKPVEQMTWAPGEAQAIRDKHISDGGWFEKLGATCYNQYRGPSIKLGAAARGKRWVDHVAKVYPDDVDHIVRYLAQRVQDPSIKPNHALVLGGEPGIGKDTLLEPAKQAVGPWNFMEISPQAMLGRFNGFIKSVILRVSEARDLEVNRYQFYEHLKTYTASPPDVLRCDEKHLREHSVLNCCGVIITTNYKTDGIYLPANDRRHYVAWSERKQEDFDEQYWNDLWGWYRTGGFEDIAAYLNELDLGGFDPKAPPPKTEAFWDIVNANRPAEEGEMSDIIDGLSLPEAITLDDVADKADTAFHDWLKDRKNRRSIPHRFEQCGYVPVRNESSKDGLWKVRGRRQVVYARNTLGVRERFTAAQLLANGRVESVGAFELYEPA